MIFSYPHRSVPCSSIMRETFYYRIDGNKCRDPRQNISQRVKHNEILSTNGSFHKIITF